jgi:sec-independent protein translocase protein TatB
MTRDAKQRLREEVGDDVDWQQLDPRRYDPRRIVREALLDESELRPMPTGTPEEPQEPAAAGHARESDEQELQPVRTATAEEPAAAVRARTFDDEAT